MQYSVIIDSRTLAQRYNAFPETSQIEMENENITRTTRHHMAKEGYRYRSADKILCR